jgi:hypothetical protein
MGGTAMAFSLIHLCLYIWTRDSNFFVGATVFLAAYMVISARAA